MYPISFNIYRMKLNEVHFSMGAIITHFLQINQEINQEANT